MKDIHNEQDHPIVLICKVIPEEFEKITGELLDKLHLVLSATGIHHAADRDEINKIITDILVDIGLVEIKDRQIKQSVQTKEIIKHYG